MNYDACADFVNLDVMSAQYLGGAHKIGCACVHL